MNISILNYFGGSLLYCMPWRFLKVLTLALPFIQTNALAEVENPAPPAPLLQRLTIAEQLTEKTSCVFLPNNPFPKVTVGELPKGKFAPDSAGIKKKDDNLKKAQRERGLTGLSQPATNITNFAEAPIMTQIFPLEGGLLPFNPLPPLLLPEKPKGEERRFFIPLARETTNSPTLTPGIYQADPFAMIVIVPAPGLDEKMVLKGDPATKHLDQIPTVKPELRFRPLKR